jgi:hypothetical protein
MALDISYFEIGYIDESYFVRTAEGVSTEPITSTMSISAGVIRGADIVMAVAFTQTVQGNDNNLAELFAFVNAQLTAAANRIRNYNIALTSSTVLAVQGTRLVYVMAQEDANFDISVAGQRLRTTTAASSAAFSSAGPLDDDGNRIQDAVGTIAIAPIRATPRTTAKLIGNLNG